DREGLAVALGRHLAYFREKCALAPSHILDRLAGHGFGEKAYKITGMPSVKRHADFAIGLEAANTRAVPGTWIDDNERSAPRVNLNRPRRDDAGQDVIDPAVERPAVDNKLYLVLKHVRRRLGQMFRIMIATLAQR